MRVAGPRAFFSFGKFFIRPFHDFWGGSGRGKERRYLHEGDDCTGFRHFRAACRQLTKEGVMDEFSPGHYKLFPAIRSYIRYQQEQIDNKTKKTELYVEKERLTQ